MSRAKYPRELNTIDARLDLLARALLALEARITRIEACFEVGAAAIQKSRGPVGRIGRKVRLR